MFTIAFNWVMIENAEHAVIIIIIEVEIGTGKILMENFNNFVFLYLYP